MFKRPTIDEVIQYGGRVVSTAALLLLTAMTVAQFAYGNLTTAWQYTTVLVCALWVIDHVHGIAERRDLRNRLDHLRWRAQQAEQRLTARDTHLVDLAARVNGQVRR